MREENERPTPGITSKTKIPRKDKKFVIEAFQNIKFNDPDGPRKWIIVDRYNTEVKRDQAFISLTKKLQSSNFYKRWYQEIRKVNL